MRIKTFRLKGALLCTSALAMAAASSTAFAQSTGAQADDEAEVITITGTRIQRSELTTPSPVQIVDSESILRSGETDIAGLLRETPALGVSRSVSNSAQDTVDGDLTGDSTGASFLNLRDLGENRTLVLVNGRRHVPGLDGTGAVDVNSIPVGLIERVETLTGGASSIYGADAVSGVVNFILKDDFEGFETRAQFGVSDEGDGEEYFLSATAGGNFADGRGNAVVNMEWRRQEFVFNGDRDYSSNEGFAGALRINDNVAAALGIDPQFGRTFVGGATLPVSSSAGRIIAFDDNGCLTSGCGFTGGSIFRDGTFREFDLGTIFNAFDSAGGDGIAVRHNTDDLIPQTDRYTGSANIRYDLLEDGGFFGLQSATWFAETKFNHSASRERQTQYGFNDEIPIAVDNPFIPAGLQDLIAGASNPVIGVYRDPTDLALRRTSRIDRDTFRIVTGIEGELFNGWNYEFHYNFGRTKVEDRFFDRNEDRYFASIDAIALDASSLATLRDDGASFRVLRPDGSSALVSAFDANVGDIICRSEFDGSEPPISPFPVSRGGFTSFDPGDDQCVPTSIFGDDAINAAAANFILAETADLTELRQETIGFVLSGELGEELQLGAGPIGFAAGFEYRDERSDFLPSALVNVGSNTFGGIESTVPPVIGGYDVWDFFGEVSVPIIADMPLVQSLIGDASVRRSDYSTAGAVTAWGAGGTWVLNDDIRFRGSFSKAVRAPNIQELFSPPVPATIGANQDPCNPDEINSGSEFRAANCAALIPIPIATYNSADFLSARVFGTTGGNPNLNVETARTYTVGAVFTPSILPQLSAAVDLYNIRISDVINDLGAFEIAQRCVDAPNLNNQFCASIDRNPNFGFITNFRSGQQNIAAFETRGIDFTVNYALDFAEMGTVDLRAVGTRVLRDREFPFQDDPSLEDDSLTEFGNPKYYLNLDAVWTLNRLSVNWQSRYQSNQLIGATAQDSARIEVEDVAADPFFCTPCRTGSAWVHDVRFGYEFGDSWDGYIAINNLADRDPFTGSVIRPANPIGRNFVFGFTKTL